VPLFLARRLVLGLAALVLVSLGTCWFFTEHFFQPGSPVPGNGWATWWTWFRGVLHGDLGTTFVGKTMWDAYASPIGHTALLLVVSFAIVAALALVIGTVSAVRAGSVADHVLRWLTYLSWGLPAFLVALILQKVFTAVYGTSGVQPLATSKWPGSCAVAVVGGVYNQCEGPHGGRYVLEVVQHLTLPAIALSFSFVGVHARYVRSSLLVTLHAPYTTTARAKGLSERHVVLRHALRNSLVAFTSALLLDFGAVFGASMAVDYVFQLGGIGSVFVGAIASPAIDPVAVTFLIVVTGAFVLLTSILNDLLISLLDPRVQLR
jgi:peptide/nickel transport system permease protein